MTRVAILPVSTTSGDVAYHAVAGDKSSQGRTAGEALDALTAQLPNDESGTLVVVQSFRSDSFFDATQQQRLSELMTRWRATRDVGEVLSAAEQTELDELIEAEIRASAERARSALDDLAR